MDSHVLVYHGPLLIHLLGVAIAIYFHCGVILVVTGILGRGITQNVPLWDDKTHPTYPSSLFPRDILCRINMGNWIGRFLWRCLWTFTFFEDFTLYETIVLFYGKTHVRVIKLIVWGWPQVTCTSPKKATLSNRKTIFQKNRLVLC